MRSLLSLVSLVSLVAGCESRETRLASREASREYREMAYLHDMEVSFTDEYAKGPVMTCPEVNSKGRLYGAPSFTWGCR